MRTLFKAAVFALVAYLVADRAMLHARASDVTAAACSERAAQVEFDALAKGFDHAAASSQRDAARSQCLVSGRARV
ncbi:adhesin [Burkholderia sp. KK1]|uniref:adhesin n=1 Tax=Caballeronia sp. CLC5 TaxID=2906764 RepID=UPI000979AC15|nr:adhesin [Caballeronia sp. CLC5]AQH02250.1 adhesin [Burkholderia sp. KK1]MCE4574434.1 adhesin [Caballeronia sp. CLC5]BBP99817.1 hypothetical protein BSFA1_49460 [Burkholderia sp. SFA1]